MGHPLPHFEWLTPDEPTKPQASIHQVLDVLSGRQFADADGMTDVQWISKLEAEDFFKDLSRAEMREILRIVARAASLEVQHTRNRLISLIEELLL